MFNVLPISNRPIKQVPKKEIDDCNMKKILPVKCGAVISQK